MTKSILSFRNTALIGALALASLTGCDALTGGAAADKGTEAPAAEAAAEEADSDLDPVLANPQVGDLWTGEMSAFSDQFNSDAPEGERKRAFGMMKVVAVTPERVTIVTETGAWEESSDARNELRGDMARANITWDPNEEIPVNRSELAQLVEDGKIIETRRIPAGEARPGEAASGKPAASE